MKIYFSCRETIYIDEEKKYMRLKEQNTKEWFNSYLTFQHIKENSLRNLVPQNDRDNMWLPIYSDINLYNNMPHKIRSPEEILRIIPQPNFNFIPNSKTDHNNARLFEVRQTLIKILVCQFHFTLKLWFLY